MDHESDRNDSDENEEISKGLPFLKKMELDLMKEVERNKALIEVEQQKLALGANSD
jgi:hypothetical protein